MSASSTSYGLLVLELPQTAGVSEEHDQPAVDIVAVHGLNGGRESTWTKDNVMWLRDLLPHKIPMARVMTFGYNADLLKNSSAFSIRDHARKLLTSLRDKRDDGDELGRPIIFICHSLGGIVVKQALVFASLEKQYANIGSSTRGIVFMGTPHRGSDLAKWGKMIAGIAKVAFLRPKSELLDDLKADSQVLRYISEDFKSIASNYQVISFYEETKLKGVTAVVEKGSALMGITQEEAIPIEGNHMGICRFSGENDDRFEAVWKSIRRLLPAAASVPTFTDQQLSLIHSLPGVNMDDHLDLLDIASPGAFDWVFSHPKFRSWFNPDGSAVLHVTGKPGSGKSVLAVSLFKRAPQNGFRANWFFYSFGAHERPKSASSVWATFAQQLLLRADAWPPNFGPTESLDSAGRPVKLWREQKLERLFKRIATSCKQKSVFLIDGWDECDATQDTLLQSFKEIMLVSSHIKLLVFSRPLQDIFPEVQFRRLVTMQLDEEDGHQLGLKEFVMGQVIELVNYRPGFGALKEEIMTKLLERADGMYLLVTLIIQDLRRLQNSSRRNIHNVLQALPKTLFEAYQEILSKVEDEDRESRYILAWILLASRPLTVDELSTALAVGPLVSSLSQVLDNRRNDLTRDREFAPLLGSFVKVDKSGVVHLVHETVKDFLFSDATPEWCRFKADNINHAIGIACMRYIELWVKEQPAKPEEQTVTFLEYTITSLPEHARRTSQEKFHKELASFLASSTGHYWAQRYWGMRDPQQLHMGHHPLHVACTLGLGDTIEVLLSSGHGIERLNLNARTPLDVAASTGRKDIVALLLDRGADVNQLMKVETDCKLLTALKTAAWHGHKDVVELLLDRGANSSIKSINSGRAFEDAAASGNVKLMALLHQRGDKINLEGRYWTALHAAAKSGRHETIDYLLVNGADLSAPNAKGQCPLQIAAMAGSESCVRSLLSSLGTTTEQPDDEGFKAIHYAASLGFEAVVSLLIEQRPEDCDVEDASGRTPFHHASASGHISICRLLFSNGADVNKLNSKGYAATHLIVANEVSYGGGYAVIRSIAADEVGYEGSKATEITQQTKLNVIRSLCKEFGADLSIRDMNGLTALQLACGSEDFSVFETLIHYDHSLIDGFDPPLQHIAAVNPNERVLSLVLDRRADVDRRDALGRTALHLAVEKPRHLENTIAVLLSKKANPNIINNHGKSPLQVLRWGFSWEDSSAVERVAISLLEAGADPNPGGDCTGLLVNALRCRGRELAKILLAKGGIIVEEKFRLEKFESSSRSTLALLRKVEGQEALVNSLIQSGKMPAQELESSLAIWINEKDRDFATTCFNAVSKESREVIIYNKWHTAALAGDVGGLSFLMDSMDIDMNATEPKTGQTALSSAAQLGHTGVAEYLLGHGASTEVPDKKGHTALWYAVRKGKTWVAQLLLMNSAQVNPHLIATAKTYMYNDIYKLLKDASSLQNDEPHG